MLIRKQRELDEMQGTHHKSCAYCKGELHFPRIVLNDATNSGYHVPCAVQMGRAVMDDILMLLHDEDLVELAKRIEAVDVFRRMGRHASSLNEAPG